MKVKNRFLSQISLVVVVLLMGFGVPLVNSTTGGYGNISHSSSEQSVYMTSDENIITITKTFELPTISLIEIDNTVYSSVEIPGLKRSAEPGNPFLPISSVKTLLPFGKTIESIDIQPLHTQLIASDIVVEPAPSYNSMSEPTSTLLSPTPNPEVYALSTPYPEALFTSVGIQHFRGYSIHYGSLSACSYIPSEGKLFFSSEIKITITLKESDSDHGASLYRGLEKDEAEVLRKVDNPNSEIVKSYRNELTVEPYYDRAYDLLIITIPEFSEGFQRLANAHRRNGIQTNIRLLGRHISLGENYVQTCINIRNYIRDQYLNYSIEYVLLGGDNTTVPAQTLYFGFNTDGYDVFGPSDFYYGCLDGCFDANGNGIYGEYPVDEVDFLAEVSVGRACVSNESEVDIFVDKTLHYMYKIKNPANMLGTHEDQYLHKILMAGEWLKNDLSGNPVFGGTFLDTLIPLIPAENYDIDTLYDRDWEGFNPQQPWTTGWPKQEIIDRINSGVHIINHHAHSGPFYNMKLYCYTNSNDIDSLTNTQLCFIYSQGCSAGAFDMSSDDPDFGYDGCIAQHLTVKTPHGAFAGIWNTRDSVIGVNTFFHTKFITAVFNEGIWVISKANQYSKEENIHLINNLFIPLHMYSLTLFGDPTLGFHDIPLSVDAHGPYEAQVNDMIQFNGSVKGGIGPYQWHWDFGDGTVSKTPTPFHTYSSAGLYNITVTVRDSARNIGKACTHAAIGLSMVWVDDDYDESTPGWQETHFNTITDGIAAVGPHGTVYINNGLYTENIVIEKTVRVEGEDKHHTIIDGMRNKEVIIIRANDVEITQVTVRNSSLMANTGKGISIEPGYENTSIQDSIITDNYRGVYVDRSSNNTICLNTFTLNTNYGVYIDGSSHNNISSNTITINNQGGVYITGQLYKSENNTISANTISNINNIGTGIILWHASYTNISGNTISHFFNGVLVRNANFNNISRNTLINNRDGVYLYSNDHSKRSTNNIIGRNTISYNTRGIHFGTYSEHNDIIDNIITHNTDDGFYFFGNPITDNRIRGNMISDNGQYGIYLRYYASRNLIVGNTIENNQQAGVRIQTSSFGNRIYHNNFNNSQNAISIQNNFWNHTDPLIGGNYWSDWEDNTGYPYNYTINANNIDYYPFEDPNGWM